MEKFIQNPETVVWSHSNRLSDFYEVPTAATELKEVIDWLTTHYSSANLWIGQEGDDGTSLYFNCTPPQPQLIAQLQTVERDLFGRAI